MVPPKVHPYAKLVDHFEMTDVQPEGVKAHVDSYSIRSAKEGFILQFSINKKGYVFENNLYDGHDRECEGNIGRS